MLKFTDHQMALVVNERNQHNAQHDKMSAIYGNQLLTGNASPLPKDVWGTWDKTGIEVQRDVLAVFNTLAVNSVSVPIGPIVHHFQTISDSGGINVSMDGESNAKTDAPVVEYHGTPVPIIDSTFSFGWRQMEAMRTGGQMIDGAAQRNSVRQVAEKLEDMTLNGDSSIKVGSDELYGLLNHPFRNTRSTGITINGNTGANIVAEVIATVKLNHAKNYRQPATLFMNWDDWFYCTSTDFSTQYPGKTILQKMLESGVREVVPASKIAANQLVAVVKSPDVVRILNGMPITTRAMFRANPEDKYNFKVMAAAALQIKYDAKDQCGIAVSS